MSSSNILIYLLRHDLRVDDNPILHRLATSSEDSFTHLLPVYVFPAQQIEVSGFSRDGTSSCYPPAKSQTGNFWRCGPHRAKFLAESVWDLKESFQKLNSGLVIRVGLLEDVIQALLDGFAEKKQKVGAVWMTAEESVEERRDERGVASVCSRREVEFKLFGDEKYFVDDRDLDHQSPNDLPDVFTNYRKTQEPLRDRPRQPVPRPEPSALPPLPDTSWIRPQSQPFFIPEAYAKLEESLLKPVKELLPGIPPFPDGTKSVHPFLGGETRALERLHYLVRTGAMSRYKDTRNGLLGVDFSTKLSGYLALGCITARQIHHEMAKFEDGEGSEYRDTEGYGKGENEGTKAVRFELLWRDYMRLCTKKFRHKLFRRSGFVGNDKPRWKNVDTAEDDASPSTDGGAPSTDGGVPVKSSYSVQDTAEILDRFLRGTTGMGLIDASQRELLYTGYTSNRARQNVASFLAKHLGIDWRYGAEWYECMLVDYDVNSNWSNWQYVAGVGNDPRGDNRIFNPVKQAFDYDKEGEYVKAWVPEVRSLEKLENVFQAWTTPAADLERLGVKDLDIVTNPVKKIEFSVEGKPRARRPFPKRRGRGGGASGATGGGAQSGPLSPDHGTSSSGDDQLQQHQQQTPYAGSAFHHQGFVPNYQGYRGGNGGYRGGLGLGPGGAMGANRGRGRGFRGTARGGSSWRGGAGGFPASGGFYPAPQSPPQPHPPAGMYWMNPNPGM